MRLEVLKTIILTGLIGLSLILTFSLWSYQTSYSGPHNADPAYIPEADAGGEVKTKRDVVVPSKAIFHIEDEHYGFDHPSNLMNMYKEIQYWSLTEYVEKEDERFELNDSHVEIEYPQSFPTEIIKSLFTLADDVELPNWNFERILISIQEEQKSVSLFFLSVDQRNYIQFTVYDQAAYAKIDELLTEKDHLVKNIVYNENNVPIYLPEKSPSLLSRTISVKTIDARVFVDALFRNPSLVVTPNFGESYFIDGQRDMRVVDEGLRLEFTNPLQNVNERMSSLEVIEESLGNINDHKGWTSDFHIAGIEKSVNRIVYQMYYDDYPVFDESERFSIEQQWRNQKLYKYNRPLYNLLSPLGEEEVELPSGNDVVYYLENMDQIHTEKVTDVKIGYYVSNVDPEYNIITLEPSWFMFYNGRWQRIRFDDLNSLDEGGL